MILQSFNKIIKGVKLSYQVIIIINIYHWVSHEQTRFMQSILGIQEHLLHQRTLYEILKDTHILMYHMVRLEK